MLTQLSIKNLAITESLELDFNHGLSVLTGETGAGKSIIIDAIGLVLGDRAEPGMIKSDAKRADIIACFDIQKLASIKDWLIEHELDDVEDNIHECILKRSLHDNGRSKGFINAQAVPLNLLKQLGEQLINIHGQNTHQQLLQSEQQRIVLDNYAKLTPLNQQINTLYESWKSEKEHFDLINQQSAERQQKQAFLNFQLQELRAFSANKNEFEKLEQEYKILSHASQIISELTKIQQLISQDEQSNAENLIAHALKISSELSAYDDKLITIDEMLNNALIQISEANSEINHYLNQVEDEPVRLNEIEERIAQYHELARKHHCEPELLLNKQIELEEEYSNYYQSDEQQELRLQKINDLQSEYFKNAQKLSKQRLKASQQLAQEVEQHIRELGLSKGEFSIDMTPVASNKEKTPVKNGLESIDFMISANPGQTPAKLAKVASGGELSRISLAIQVVTAQYNQTPSIIFDEIDVGVGGKIAEMIGAKLAQLSNQSQILCVTHQAQVAVHGHNHYLVEKSFQENSTTSHITELDEQQRIDELSRMLSGAEITETTRLHAREMLNQARKQH
ncbi:MAG: DNA repair protein RecN [Gammaproteobacteria bacterium]|nr:DNA repair protein RecN [Gammaproteobacteria bacterium]